MNQLTTQNPQALELLKGSFQLIQLERFFDVGYSEPRSAKKLWISPKASQIENLEANIRAEGLMWKRGRKLNQWITRYYIMTSDFLAYKETKQSKKIKKIMMFDRVKFECFGSQDLGDSRKHGILLQKNKTITKLYCEDFTMYEKFRKELQSRCILNTFQEDYIIEKLIGSGAFGKVYLIKRKKDDKKFAAKMFFKDSLLKQNKGRESLLNEIKILQNLDHKGIMKLYEVHESMLSVFLIMELLEGGELLETLQERRYFSENDCAMMLKKIMEPLAYMHSRGIMHRDIKPENLILRSAANKDFDIVIADFGLAQQQKSQKVIHYRCGTPGYCAPEILNSHGDKIEYDLKCDVFSVGCLFYYIMAGQHPFAAKYQKDVYKKNREGTIITDESKVTLLSPMARDLLFKMLARNPQERPTFEQCLSHGFFVESNRNNHNLFTFTIQSLCVDLGGVAKLKPEVSTKDGSPANREENNSFVLGRPSMIKGRLETMNEMAGFEIEKSVRSGADIPKLGSASKVETKLTLLSPATSKYLSSMQNFKPPEPVHHHNRRGSELSVAENYRIKEEDESQPQSRGELALGISGRIKDLTSNGAIRNPFSQSAF